MAQGFLIGLPQRLFTSNGLPADGWKLSYTNAGLGTPVTTYSDATLTSQNTDPVVTDADGYFRVFVAEAVIVDIVVTDENDVQQFTLESIEAMPDTSGSSPSVTAVPTGAFLPYVSGAAAPTGFLYCDGAAVSRATYTALDTLLAAATPPYPYGDGDGSTTFNVPDMRGYFPFGVASSGTGSTLGTVFGVIDHHHTGDPHVHTVDVPRGGWGQNYESPPVSGRMSTGYASGTGQFSSAYQATADQTVTSSAAGEGDTGTANPPGLPCYFIIKT